ncbi:MAG TPA: extracellular solute-binding protein, partial [Chloroflexota bacterium]|nr:extracellular solute-binding protein [Chloroflexota bacterium]
PIAASPSAKPGASTSAAAAASGTVTVYGALTQENGDAFAKTFESATPGSKVNMVVAGSGPLMSRITAEQQAGGVKADVILLADPTAMNGLVASGVITDYAPKDAAQLPQSLRGSGWSGAFTFHNLILQRKGIATAAKDWTDLNNQAYKGAIELGDPAASGTTLAMAGTLSQSLGWDYFRNLQKLGARIVASTNTVGTDVAGGQMQVGITLDSVGRDLVKKGSPVEMVWPASGAIPVPAPVGIVKGHDSAAAKAFVDWLISPQGQATSVQLGYAPAYGSSDAVPAGTKTTSVDWDQLAKNRDTILSTWKSIFG